MASLFFFFATVFLSIAIVAQKKPGLIRLSVFSAVNCTTFLIRGCIEIGGYRSASFHPLVSFGNGLIVLGLLVTLRFYRYQAR